MANLQVRDWIGQYEAKRRTVKIGAGQIYFGGSKGEPASEGNADGERLPSVPEQDLISMEDDGELPVLRRSK